MKLYTIILALLAMPLMHGSQMKKTEYCNAKSQQFIEQVRARMEKENKSVDEVRYDSDTTPLMVAAYSGYIPAIEHFLKLGADINLKNTYGKTALMHAATNSSSRVTDTVEFLLKHGADSNAKDNWDRTALQSALGSQRPQAAAAILRDPNFKIENLAIKENEAFPLHIAVGNGYADVVQAIIDRNANLDTADEKGNTALMYAVKYKKPDMVELLIAHGANTELKDANDNTAFDLVYDSLIKAEDEYDRFEAQKAMPYLYNAFRQGKKKYQDYLKRKQQIGKTVSESAFGNIQGYPLTTIVTDYLDFRPADMVQLETKTQQEDTNMRD